MTLGGDTTVEAPLGLLVCPDMPWSLSLSLSLTPQPLARATAIVRCALEVLRPRAGLVCSDGECHMEERCACARAAEDSELVERLPLSQAVSRLRRSRRLCAEGFVGIAGGRLKRGCTAGRQSVNTCTVLRRPPAALHRPGPFVAQCVVATRPLTVAFRYRLLGGWLAASTSCWYSRILLASSLEI